MDSLSHLVADPAAWLALATLIVMEVVLGIDNLVFVSILTNKLPEAMRGKARRLGIAHGCEVIVTQNGHRLNATAAVRSGVPGGSAFLADGLASESANVLTESLIEVLKV